MDVSRQYLFNKSWGACQMWQRHDNEEGSRKTNVCQLISQPLHWLSYDASYVR